MGFNNWARFMCSLNETLFVQTADAMATNGLLAAGYNNINLDDCWSLKNRTSTNQLQWDPVLFPHGMPWLGDYLHARGFKFGIYTNAGTQTCGLYPGSQDHEEIDAKTFESWGVDYLKVDGCHMDLQHNRTYYQEFEYRYKLWGSVISKLSHPFIFSQSAPAYFSPNFHVDKNNTDWYRTMQYVRNTGELARHSDDIKVYGNNPTNTFEPGGHWESILNNYDKQIRLARYQSCGFYNDPDFLIIDWPDLSLEEKKTHFTLWSAFSAPLILSAWIPALRKEDIAYLTNKDIIAVDQDALCEQATLVSQDGTFDVLTKSLSNGDRLLTVLNRSNHTRRLVIPLERLGIVPSSDEEIFFAKDLWSKSLTTIRNAEFGIELRSHQTGIWRIFTTDCITCSPDDLVSHEKLSITPTGAIFNTFSMNCLTSTHRNAKAVFTTCNGDDEQVWRVSSNGAISPLSARDKCLTTDGEDVILQKCGRGAKDQQWSYGVDGNLVSRVYKGLCLQEVASGRPGRELPVTVRKCGVAVDSQVFALPGGVKLER
jgi:alpha-galactosidase